MRWLAAARPVLLLARKDLLLELRREFCRLPRDIRMVIDVDPVNMM